MPIEYIKNICVLCEEYKPVKFYPCIKRDYGFEIKTFREVKHLEYEVLGFCRNCAKELRKK